MVVGPRLPCCAWRRRGENKETGGRVKPILLKSARVRVARDTVEKRLQAIRPGEAFPVREAAAEWGFAETYLMYRARQTNALVYVVPKGATVAVACVTRPGACK